MLTMTIARRAASLAFVAALAACSRNPQPAIAPTPSAAPAVAPMPSAAPARVAAPTPAAAPVPAAPAPATRFEIAGDWDWTATFQGQPFDGTLSFQASGGSYNGLMRVAGQFDATVRTVTVTGDAVRAMLDSPQGEMVLEARFTDANTLSGVVNVLAAGEAASFSATRRR